MYLHIPCQVSKNFGEIARLEGELTSAKSRNTDLEKSLEARKQNEAKILKTSAEEKGQLEKRIKTLQVCVCVLCACVHAYICRCMWYSTHVPFA